VKRIVILTLLAAGCAHKEPAMQVRTVEVPVLRVEKCVAAGDVPRRPAALPKRPKSISAALDLAVAKVLEWQSYGDRADAVLKGCAG
jgi:hypothetical protein